MSVHWETMNYLTQNEIQLVTPYSSVGIQNAIRSVHTHTHTNTQNLKTSQDSFPLLFNDVVITEKHMFCPHSMYYSTDLNFCLLAAYRNISFMYINYIFCYKPLKSLVISNQVLIQSCNKTQCFSLIIFPLLCTKKSIIPFPCLYFS